MKRDYDLSTLEWVLSGWIPEYWRFVQTMEIGARTRADVAPIPVRIPCSVQGALRQADELPDWNAGLDARGCEWVENRHWIYETTPPDDWFRGGQPTLVCEGLDYNGRIFFNGTEVGAFLGSLTPHRFDLSGAKQEHGNRLRIVFECPPRWLGQFGFTSKMTEWKPRFNYTWDWTSRLVQIGIWDPVRLEVADGPTLGDLRCRTGLGDGGVLWLQAPAQGKVNIRLAHGHEIILDKHVEGDALTRGIAFTGLPVEPWQPNPSSSQPLYTLSVEGEADRVERTVGFKSIEWQACEGAPAEADPWICVVNGQPTFLQGVNWTPIRPNFADVTEDDYRQRLELYRDLGCNLLRVWGGGFLEKEVFYRLCDELGILVWQEFPLSSSGHENWPPEDEQSIGELTEIARSYIKRRQHHACLLLWCGGNELQGAMDGGKQGIGKPVDGSHPLMTRFAQLVETEDPGRRFLPSSSSGPRFTASADEFGTGVHWDVHGPWSIDTDLEGWANYWAADDALFRSETGVAGASDLDIVEAFSGDLDPFPASDENPLWRRSAWWIDWPAFREEHSRDPRDLAEYVAWSQSRQAQALAIAAQACKGRFPRCGGFLVWMGHDSFPCTANTAIIDFWGRPKPAAFALKAIWRSRPVCIPCL